MTNREKAEIILERLDKYASVNWNFVEYYMKPIIKALEVIDEEERRKKIANYKI